MADIKRLTSNGIKAARRAAVAGLDKIDVDAIKDKAEDIKETATDIKENIEEKITELDRMLEQAVTDYNDAFTIMNDNGYQLYLERSKAVDTLSFAENLINSMTNSPKEFASDFEEINTQRKQFKDACDFAERQLEDSRAAAAGSGAGLAAGASVAFMAPTAAMWVATTFGTASTGAAISTLSGAAATNAALAWLGGGAVASGGGGMVAGNALLALAGPVGLGIAGATLLSSIVLYSTKRRKLNKEKNEEIESIKKNTASVKKMNAEIEDILNATRSIREGLNSSYTDALHFYKCDFRSLTSDEQHQLQAFVNNSKALAKLFERNVNTETN